MMGEQDEKRRGYQLAPPGGVRRLSIQGGSRRSNGMGEQEQKRCPLCGEVALEQTTDRLYHS